MYLASRNGAREGVMATRLVMVCDGVAFRSAVRTSHIALKSPQRSFDFTFGAISHFSMSGAADKNARDRVVATRLVVMTDEVTPRSRIGVCGHRGKVGAVSLRCCGPAGFDAGGSGTDSHGQSCGLTRLY